MTFQSYSRFILALASALLISACSDGQRTAVEIGNERQILHMGNGGEPSDVDPHTTVGIPERQIQVALFEGLVSKSSDTLEIQPGVAHSWDISDDGLVYTFYLNENARWSNGDPITAQDFVWSWRRALLPALGNQYAYSLYSLKNAEDFHRERISNFDQVGVTAVDERTLRIELENPVPYFLELLDHHSFYPVHPATVEQFGRPDQRGTRWTRPENFVGNGPFTLKSWEPNRVLVVEKNRYYWDADQVRLNEIHFYPVEQPATEERMFRAGQLHIINLLAEERVPRYLEQENPALRSTANYATYYYEFNTRVKPLDDPRVRRALSLAIDREKITDQMLRGGQRPAEHFTPPGAGFEARARISHDPEKARQLLAEAGFPNGEGFPTLNILYNTLDAHERIAVVIQQMWRQTLNINVTLRNQDWRVYLASKRSADYQIARSGWVGDYYDPNTFLDMFLTEGGNNDTGWSNPRYDELIALAAATDSKQRMEYFQEAEAILLEEAPFAPIYFYQYNYLVSPSVRGWHSNVMKHVNYKGVYLEPQQ
jgi:oligopeptide transport system substrate-binding protein